MKTTHYLNCSHGHTKVENDIISRLTNEYYVLQYQSLIMIKIELRSVKHLCTLILCKFFCKLSVEDCKAK